MRIDHAAVIEGPRRVALELDDERRAISFPLEQLEGVFHWFRSELLLVPKFVVELEEPFTRSLRAVDETGHVVLNVEVADNFDSALVQFIIEVFEPLPAGLQISISG